jgi:hypothetical protein
LRAYGKQAKSGIFVLKEKSFGGGVMLKIAKGGMLFLYIKKT